MHKEIGRRVKIRNANNYIELIRIQAFTSADEGYRKSLLAYHQSRLEDKIIVAKPGLTEDESKQVLKAMFGMYRHSLHMPQAE